MWKTDMFYDVCSLICCTEVTVEEYNSTTSGLAASIFYLKVVTNERF